VFVPRIEDSAAADDGAEAATSATEGTAAEDTSSDADALTSAALRTPLPYFLKHGVLVSMRDRRIARKIWNYLKAQFPAKSVPKV
jgi:hypothetical protein